ncbi:MAG TPA: adenosylcobinamide-GDP ribazoletransferase [Ktedonobacterales bacterium]|nr:adenosylcobinamide-GDP ribazoletransferase [Ktedonobacterales bacterium]
MIENRRVSPLTGLALAVEFLTVVPVRRVRSDAAADAAAAATVPHDMSLALPWFPLVGAMLGLALVIVDWLLSLAFPLGVRSVGVLVFDALITGMLHLDGFVDCCDALPGRRSIERRLEILRDSRVGAYGALGGTLLMITRYAALTALVGPLRWLALLAAPVLGRWAIVYVVSRYPYARSSGAGTPFRTRGAAPFVLATGSMLLLLACNVLVNGRLELTLTVAGVIAGLLLLAAIATMLGWGTWASRRLGGALTGDTYGAVCVLVELAVLLVVPPLASVATQAAQLIWR